MAYLLRAVLASILATVLVPGAWAQGYPSKLVRIVIPTSAGGVSDPAARWIAQKLSENWTQPVILDFRDGASGIIGTDHVAKSAPDGYTMLFNTGGFWYQQATAANLPYTLQDFAPITPALSGPTVFVANASLGAANVKELIALAKKSPGKLTFASTGAGGPPHMNAELFKVLTGTDILHVPYKGAGPAIVDVVAGRVDMMFTGLPVVAPHLKTGKLVAIAVSSMERSRSLPDLPSVHEQGVTGFDAGSRMGFIAPARTPEDTINRIHGGLVKVLSTPETRKTFAGLGIEPIHSTPAEYSAWIRSQVERWIQVAKSAGLKRE